MGKNDSDRNGIKSEQNERIENQKSVIDVLDIVVPMLIDIVVPMLIGMITAGLTVHAWTEYHPILGLTCAALGVCLFQQYRRVIEKVNDWLDDAMVTR